MKIRPRLLHCKIEPNLATPTNPKWPRSRRLPPRAPAKTPLRTRLPTLVGAVALHAKRQAHATRRVDAEILRLSTDEIQNRTRLLENELKVRLERAPGGAAESDRRGPQDPEIRAE